MNKVILIGRLTKNPELKSTTSGKSVLQFTLAETQRYGNGKETTSYHNIVVWEGKAETIAKYCKQGDQIIIEGSLRYRDYNDRSGNKKSITEILVESFEFGAKKQIEGDPFDHPAENISWDELPF